MSTLEQRIARLEAIEEIKQLKARYCAVGDAPFDDRAISALFTPDAVWDGGRFGRHEGIAAILAIFKRTKDVAVFSAHLIANPIIAVDGDRATGQWWILCPGTRVQDGGKHAYWMLVRYHDVYVRRDGRWLIREVNADFKFVALHRDGWADKT